MRLFFNSSHSCTTILSYIKGGYKIRRLCERKKVRDECHIIWSNYTQPLTCICLTYECPCSYKWVSERRSAESSLPLITFPFCLVHRLSTFRAVAKPLNAASIFILCNFLILTLEIVTSRTRKQKLSGKKFKLHSLLVASSSSAALVVLFY